MTADRPAWFDKAVATTYTSRFVPVENWNIHCQSWGRPHRPALLFVHGNGAHTHWWDFIAPFFSEDFYVAACDLGGMGDSDHRPEYSPESYAREILAVSAALPASGRPLLIGHSFGARVVFKALQMFPEAFSGAILADAPFHPPDHQFHFHKRRGKPVKPHRVYGSLGEGKERFRLFPEQPCANDYIVDYIAGHSLQRVAQGWSWKFDPKIYSTFDYEGLLSTRPTGDEKLFGVIYGEHSSLYSDKVRRYNHELFRSLQLPEPVVLPDAHHHLLLDQPQAFVEEIRKMVAPHLNAEAQMRTL